MEIGREVRAMAKLTRTCAASAAAQGIGRHVVEVPSAANLFAACVEKVRKNGTLSDYEFKQA